MKKEDKEEAKETKVELGPACLAARNRALYEENEELRQRINGLEEELKRFRLFEKIDKITAKYRNKETPATRGVLYGAPLEE